MFELADKLKALRDQKDALEAELKQVNMALCTSCHSEITAREGGRWG